MDFLKSIRLPAGLATAFNHRNFRLYFGGMCVSLIGTWMQQIAISWLAYRLSGSVWWLAVVAGMAQLPLLFLTPFFSVWADRYDRRRILFFTQTLSMGQALLLAYLTLTGTIAIGHLLCLSLFIGCVNALDAPTRQAFYPTLVPAAHLPNAIVLNSAVINGTRLIGPAIGGALIGIFGEGFCFLLNGISYLGVLLALCSMRLTFTPVAARPRQMWNELQEGLEYVASHLPLRSLLLLMAMVSFFGLPLVTFLPAYVKDVLGGGSELLGAMLSCAGIGSLLAAFLLACRNNVFSLGKTIAAATCCLGFCLIGFFWIRLPWVAAILCLGAGFTLIMTSIAINTLLQSLTAEEKRGRVMGYMTMAFTGISPVGGLVLGALEKYWGLPAILLISGISCTTGALVFEYYRPLIHRNACSELIHKGFTGKN